MLLVPANKRGVPPLSGSWGSAPGPPAEGQGSDERRTDRAIAGAVLKIKVRQSNCGQACIRGSVENFFECVKNPSARPRFLIVDAVNLELL